MKTKLLNLIKSGVLTRDEAIEYVARIAEHFDFSGLHKVADIYWQIAKQL